MNLEQPARPSDKLWNVSYVSLLLCQFMGAMNDNVLKQCITFMVATGGIWAAKLGAGGQAVPALCLTLPFILLSGYGGQIADRFSKQRVIVWVKLAEIPIAFIALFGFWSQNLWVTLGALLLLSAQSSFFGPAKYGVIPELVSDRHLSQANGFINMFTNLAVIVGSLIAGPLSDAYHPRDGQPSLAAPGAMMVMIATLGLAVVVGLPRLRAAAPDLKYDYNPLATYISTLAEMAHSPLLTVALAWSGFYMIGMIALLIVPEYGDLLNIEYTRVSYLLGTLGIAIAVGSVACGLLSGHQIRPWFIPFGAVGMTLCFLALGSIPPNYANVAALIFFTGFFAGFYIVPLQALLQHLSPENERGRFLGTANALSFVFTSAGGIVFWAARNPLGMAANRVHLICAAMALMGTTIGILKLRRLG